MSTQIVMNELALLELLEYSKKYFSTSRYLPMVEKAELQYRLREYENCHETLCKLPTRKQLFSELTEKLKEKSVYKTLKLIEKKHDLNPATSLKGLFSLATHAMIECEKGNTEYKCLLPQIYEKIGEELFKL